MNYFLKAYLTYHITMCQVPLISLDSTEPGRASKQDSYQELPNIVKRTFQGTFPKTFPSLSVRRTTDQENQVAIVDRICFPYPFIVCCLVLQNILHNNNISFNGSFLDILTLKLQLLLSHLSSCTKNPRHG